MQIPFRYVRRIYACLLVLSLLVYLRPYYGIRHDAVLYLGQGLLRLDPANFSSDLFFVYGSQANFTVIPQILGGLLSQVSAADLFRGLAFAGLVSFAGASWILLRQLYDLRAAYWGLLALIVLPSFYGGVSIFSYAEVFFTARTIAEPLALIGLAAYFQRHFVWAAAAVTLAALIHPLQAIPVVLILWFDLVRTNKKWGLLTLAPPMAAGLSWAGLPGWPDLLIRFDRAWLEISTEASPQTFIAHWQLRDWVSLLIDVFLLGSVYRITTNTTLRRLIVSAVAMTALAIAVTYVGADRLHLVHITGLQIWRTHWIVHWLAVTSVPLLIYSINQKHDPLYVRTLLLILVVIIPGPNATLLAGGAINLLIIPLFTIWPHINKMIGPKVRWIVLIVIGLIFTILLAKLGIAAYDQYIRLGGSRDEIRIEFFILSHPLVAGSLLIFFLSKSNHLLKKNAKSSRSATLLACILLMLATSLWQWDRRNKWTRELESAESNPKIFGVPIESAGQVFWENELLAPWLILGRPSYYSGAQASGVIFNRQTAIEVSKRREALKLIEFQARVCQMFNELNKQQGHCAIDITAAKKICHDSRGALNYLVLENRIDKSPEGTWLARGGSRGRDLTEYHLYSCRQLDN